MDSESDLGFISPGLPASPLQGLALLFVGVDAERVVAGGLQKALGPGPVPDLLGGLSGHKCCSGLAPNSLS